MKTQVIVFSKTCLLTFLYIYRISDVQALLEAQEKLETRNIVSLKHFSIAVHGLTQLLQRGRSDLFLNPSNAEDPRDPVDKLGFRDDHSLDQAVLILPLLNDYISHYLKMLECSTDRFEASPSTTTMSSSSGSFDSSIESSLGLFLKDSAMYANSLESLALSSLRILHILTTCQSVRKLLLLDEHKIEGISESSGSNESKKHSTLDANSKEKQGTHIPKNYFKDLHLLQKLIKLADPGRKVSVLYM